MFIEPRRKQKKLRQERNVISIAVRSERFEQLGGAVYGHLVPDGTKSFMCPIQRALTTPQRNSHPSP